MVDQLSLDAACRVCGIPLSDPEQTSGELCPTCAARYGEGEAAQRDPHAPSDLVPPAHRPAPVDPAVSAQPPWSPSAPPSVAPAGAPAWDYAGAAPAQAGPSDPDRPHWGWLSGLGSWFFSVASIVVFPLLAFLIYIVYYVATGNKLPPLDNREELLAWVMNPTSILIQVVSTFPAHLATILFCWLLVTRRGKYPFWQSLGWEWKARSKGWKVLYTVCAMGGILLLLQLIELVVPQGKETDFDRILKASTAVRVAIAIMAVATAPLVEEVVYRGVLYSGLRKYMGAVPTVAVVTILFAGVHFPQYFGAWRTLVGITVLSLVLTVVRAHTKSLYPPFMIHLINNAFGAIMILLGKS